MPDGTTAPKPRILLAEEQAAVRDLIVLGLSRLGYRIESVSNGGDALARARCDPPDLLLLSTSLPDMHPAPLIGALREFPGLDRVPVVAICQRGPEGSEASMAAGAAAYLSQPLEIERLASLIERLVQPGGATAHEPVLDLDHLRHFTDDDPQLEGEISALFLSTSEIYLQQMHEALQCGRAWTSIAHALKGASANLGARRIATLALAAERSEPSPVQLEAIEQAVDEVRDYFRRRNPAGNQPSDWEGSAGPPTERP